MQYKRNDAQNGILNSMQPKKKLGSVATIRRLGIDPLNVFHRYLKNGDEFLNTC